MPHTAGLTTIGRMNADITSALTTDLYQLTMACGYWKLGMAHTEAAFTLTFRSHPFGGGYAIAGGLAGAIDYLQSLRFDDDALTYLASLNGYRDQPLFDPDFLQAVRELKFSCDVDAVPEGSVVFANEPLVRVVGPIWQAQLVETTLLPLVNFQTLNATKAARICQAAAGD